jgi:hypothetical protein
VPRSLGGAGARVLIVVQKLAAEPG